MEAPGTGDDFAALADKLEQAQFTIAFRGFEPREVHALLAEVAQRLREAIHHGRPDDVVRARRIGTAEDEAARIIEEAKAEAQRIIEGATREAGELRHEAAEFREQARASVLEGIRNANALMQQAREERSSPSS